MEGDHNKPNPIGSWYGIVRILLAKETQELDVVVSDGFEEAMTFKRILLLCFFCFCKLWVGMNVLGRSNG